MVRLLRNLVHAFMHPQSSFGPCLACAWHCLRVLCLHVIIGVLMASACHSLIASRMYLNDYESGWVVRLVLVRLAPDAAASLRCLTAVCARP